MSYHVHGRCHCGGYVVTPKAWLGIYPPIPACNSCGETVKEKKS